MKTKSTIGERIIELRDKNIGRINYEDIKITKRSDYGSLKQ